jgi:hypothetical protein
MTTSNPRAGASPGPNVQPRAKVVRVPTGSRVSTRTASGNASSAARSRRSSHASGQPGRRRRGHIPVTSIDVIPSPISG